MGLKVTSEIYTDGGVTSEAYLNISKVVLSKDNELSIFVTTYLSLQERQANIANTVRSKQIYSRLGVSDFGSPSILENMSIYAAAYSLLKDRLELDGLVVLDEI